MLHEFKITGFELFSIDSIHSLLYYKTGIDDGLMRDRFSTRVKINVYF